MEFPHGCLMYECSICRESFAALYCVECSSRLNSWRRDIPHTVEARDATAGKCNKLQHTIRQFVEQNRLALVRECRRDSLQRRTLLFRQKLKELREKNQKKRSKIQNLQNEIFLRKLRLEEAKDYIAHFQANSLEPAIDRKNSHAVEQAQQLLEAAGKRREQIVELLSIFPLIPFSDTETIVINLRLPNNGKYSHIPTVVRGTALGYIVQIVNLISYILRIPVPFRMTFFGSLSYVTTWDGSSQFMLTHSNKTSDENNMARKMLNTNVTILCFSQGVIVTRPACITTNLLALVRSSKLGKFGPHSFAIVTPSNEFKLLELNSQASSKFISDQHTVGSSITPQDVEDAIDLSQIHSFDMKSENDNLSLPNLGDETWVLVDEDDGQATSNTDTTPQ